MFARSVMAFAALGLFLSCAPKDQKVIRPLDPTKSAPPAAVTAADAKADNYKHLAVLVERQSEIIQLFKVLTDSDFAAKKMFTVEDVTLNAAAFKKITAQVETKSSLNSISNTISLLAQVQLNENKSVQKIVITENKDNLSLDSIVKIQDKTDLVLKNKTKKIVIEKSATDDSYNVTFDSIDEANAKAGKTLILNNLKFNFSKITDADVESYKINSLELSHSRYGVQTADFSMKSAQIDLVSKMNEQCSSLTGHLSLNSLELDKTKKNPLYTRGFTFDDSSLILKAGKDTYDLKAAPCAERPVVDLTKLF